MKKYKAYIFDMDLTLMDTINPSIECYKNAFKAAGYEFNESDIYRQLAQSLVITYDEFINPKCSFAEFRKAYVEIAQDAIANEAILYDDVIKNIIRLHEEGKILGIVTNRATFEIYHVLDRYDIRRYFNSVITSDKVKCLKPDPESINMCISELNVDKENVVYVGDAYNDLLASQNASIDYIEIDRYNSCNFQTEVILNNIDKL